MEVLKEELLTSFDLPFVRQQSTLLSPTQPLTHAEWCARRTPQSLCDLYHRAAPVLKTSAIGGAALRAGVRLDSLFTALVAIDEKTAMTGGGARASPAGSATLPVHQPAALPLSPTSPATPTLTAPAAPAVTTDLTVPIDERRVVVCGGCGHRRYQERYVGSAGGSCGICGMAATSDVQDSNPRAQAEQWQLAPMSSQPLRFSSSNESPVQPDRVDRVTAKMTALCSTAKRELPPGVMGRAKRLVSVCPSGSVEARVAAAVLLALNPDLLSSLEVDGGGGLTDGEDRLQFACSRCGATWSRRLDATASLCCTQAPQLKESSRKRNRE